MKLNKWLFMAVIAVLIFWFGVPALIFYKYGVPTDPGVIGDTFGSVNALFSSLAFVLLIYTALMQREELELQRNELQLTRDEIKKSAEAQNNLVKLTERNLDLQVKIRRNQITPELMVVTREFTNEEAEIKIKLKPKFHALKVTGLEVSGTDNLIPDVHHLQNSIFHRILASEFNIILQRVRENDIITNYILVFTLSDIDDETFYSQTINFTPSNTIVKPPVKIKPDLR